MSFGSFVDGPLLWIVFCVFIAGIVLRLVFFVLSLFRSKKYEDLGWGYVPISFFRLFLPFHKGVSKKPSYAIPRYVFHICLIVVPIWLSGHILLWEESSFAWSWTALPDAWADWMTILLLGLAAYFLVRRLVFSNIRLDSAPADYILIVITALPFLTGYFLAHSSLAETRAIGNNVRLVHLLSAEVFLITTVFLFVRTQLSAETCTGCASCEISCPTGTLESQDEGNERSFNYSRAQCIFCGTCVGVCPEEAAELRHQMGVKRFFQAGSKERIRTVELSNCKGCGQLYAPGRQLDKIGESVPEDYILFCENCKNGLMVEGNLRDKIV